MAFAGLGDQHPGQGDVPPHQPTDIYRRATHKSFHFFQTNGLTPAPMADFHNDRLRHMTDRERDLMAKLAHKDILVTNWTHPQVSTEQGGKVAASVELALTREQAARIAEYFRQANTGDGDNKQSELKDNYVVVCTRFPEYNVGVTAQEQRQGFVPFHWDWHGCGITVIRLSQPPALQAGYRCDLGPDGYVDWAARVGDLCRLTRADVGVDCEVRIICRSLDLLLGDLLRHTYIALTGEQPVLIDSRLY